MVNRLLNVESGNKQFNIQTISNYIVNIISTTNKHFKNVDWTMSNWILDSLLEVDLNALNYKRSGVSRRCWVDNIRVVITNYYVIVVG